LIGVPEGAAEVGVDEPDAATVVGTEDLDDEEQPPAATTTAIAIMLEVNRARG
jgi:hypothetical protein